MQLLRGLTLALLVAGAALATPRFEDAQSVLAQRPDGTWQEAMIDGQFNGATYPVQFMAPPYGRADLPPEKIRLDPTKGTLDDQLRAAFPPVPQWSRVRVKRGERGETAWAIVTGERGIEFKVVWEDGSGRARIRHRDIVEQGAIVAPRGHDLLDAMLGLASTNRESRGRKPRGEANCDLGLGFHVHARDADDGRWYAARIAKRDGCTYLIEWDDGADHAEYRAGNELRVP